MDDKEVPDDSSSASKNIYFLRKNPSETGKSTRSLHHSETATKRDDDCVYKVSTNESWTVMQKLDLLSCAASSTSKTSMWAAKLMPGTPDKVSILNSIRDNCLFLLREKDEELAQLQWTISDRETQIQLLQLNIDSLKSQLENCEKQIMLMCQANKAKDDHLNDELLGKLTVCNTSQCQHIADEEKLPVKSDAPHTATNVSYTASSESCCCCCYENGQASSNVVTDTVLPNTEMPNKMNKPSHMELMSVCAQLSDTRNLLATKEEALEEATVMISNLRMQLQNQTQLNLNQTAELKHMTMQLLDTDIEKLQVAISEKDTAIAVMEMQALSSQYCLTGQRPPTEALHQERQKLTQELKIKMQKKIKLQTVENEKIEYHSIESDQLTSEHQISHAIRTLEKTKIKVKKYIDQLLAVVLDNDPSMLEGMPRIQQSPSMSPDLLGVASLPELMDELKEEEESVYTLQRYAALLLEKITEHSPKLLNCLDIPMDNF